MPKMGRRGGFSHFCPCRAFRINKCFNKAVWESASENVFGLFPLAQPRYEYEN